MTTETITYTLIRYDSTTRTLTPVGQISVDSPHLEDGRSAAEEMGWSVKGFKDDYTMIVD